MFIFSFSKTLASASLPCYSRVYIFGFHYLLALTFNKPLIFNDFIYKRKYVHHSRFLTLALYLRFVIAVQIARA